MKGFRQQPQANRKDEIRAIKEELKQLAMASRINQMMTQQLMQNLRNMQEDLGRALGIVTELQYKLLAVQKVGNFSVEEMNEIANEQRLTDFCEASDREDREGNFTTGTVVDKDSTVILTSTTEEKDRGIFRSRIKLSTCGVPDLIQAFTGREVGARAIVKLNGLDHEVELLAIRQPPPASETAGDESACADDESDSCDHAATQPPVEAGAGQVVGNA